MDEKWTSGEGGGQKRQKMGGRPPLYKPPYGIHRKVNSCSGCCNQHPFVAVNMRSSDLYFAFFLLSTREQGHK